MSLTQHDWDKRFLMIAICVSTWSKDPSTQCGCVIVKDKHIISTGYNGYPKGIDDNTSDSRELKLAKTIHAESNAILHAKTSVVGATLYVYPFQPCSNCSAVIAQVGIARVVVGLKPNKDDTLWIDSFRIGEKILHDCNVTIERVIL